MAKSIKLKNNTFWDISSLGGAYMGDYEGDLNDLTKSGIYAINTIATNKPTNSCFYVVVISRDKVNYVLQIAIDRDSENQRIYTRRKRGSNSWNNWIEVPSYDKVNTERVQQAYLGRDPNINEYRYTSGIYGIYNCSLAPNLGIGTLEVMRYSNDWVLQRFTEIDYGTWHTWERVFYGGTTWSNWIQRW